MKEYLLNAWFWYMNNNAYFYDMMSDGLSIGDNTTILLNALYAFCYNSFFLLLALYVTWVLAIGIFLALKITLLAFMKIAEILFPIMILVALTVGIFVWFI